MIEPLEIEGNIQDSTDAFYLTQRIAEYLCDETAAQHGNPLPVSITVEVGSSNASFEEGPE